LKKVLGILGLLVAISAFTAAVNPDFLEPYNLQNLIRRTSLYGILSIGVAFVIITGGIDLSLGSVVGLVGVLVPWLLVEQGFGIPAMFLVVLATCLAIGLIHGLLVTRLSMQPFIVTLCGLLFYRGVARFLTDDQTQGFGTGYTGLRQIAKGEPCTLAFLAMVLGAAGVLLLAWVRRLGAFDPRGVRLGLGATALAALSGALVWLLDVPRLSEIRAPMPFLVLIGVALASGVFLNLTVWGRYLFALGRNEEAARYSGIDTARMTVLAYVLCALLAGLGGVLFALDTPGIQPASHGSFYELYAIAAAVLGGCSLRGGEGSVLGVVIGAAVMRVLYNSINLLSIPTQLEFAIIGIVILLGVVADEVVQRVVAARRERRPT